MGRYKIIAFANQKGGVGKTTSAVNVSACAAKSGKKTLLIDIDPQGNATTGLGIDKKRSGLSSYDLFIGRAKAGEVIADTCVEKLSIIPASIDLVGAEIELVDQEKREFRLKAALTEIKDDFDLIFIDCPPSLGLITLNALTAADGLIIPVLCEFYSLEGLSQLTSTVRHVKGRLNPSLDILGVLINMYDGRLTLNAQVLDEIKKYFGSKVISRPVPRNIKLSEAPSYGLPAFMYDRYAKGTRAYEEITNEIIKRSGA
ncbi:MAG: AAA family ATPase [Eubacteriales bacterium]